MYVWDTGPGRWNFASMVTVPFAKLDVNVDVRFNTRRFGAREFETSDDDFGLYDITVAPVIASYHFSETRHLSLSVYVFAPTGDYEPGRLANLSLNNWTFSPTVDYTQLFQAGTLEFSALAAVDIYTENDDTDYQNGDVFRLDALLIKRFHSGWGFGAVGGWINQFEDDDGPGTDRLNGFRGRALGLGPTITYGRKWSGGELELALRWLKEFEVEKRPEGKPLMLTATIQF